MSRGKPAGGAKGRGGGKHAAKGRGGKPGMPSDTRTGGRWPFSGKPKPAGGKDKSKGGGEGRGPKGDE